MAATTKDLLSGSGGKFDNLIDNQFNGNFHAVLFCHQHVGNRNWIASHHYKKSNLVCMLAVDSLLCVGGQ